MIKDGRPLVTEPGCLVQDATFVVLGVSAYLIRKKTYAADGQRTMRMALGFLTIFVPLQITLGDMHGLNTRQYQPAKLAAIEGC